MFFLTHGVLATKLVFGIFATRKRSTCLGFVDKPIGPL